jgi:cyclophilin family peptidyl-prolyl cis-trans isomerase
VATDKRERQRANRQQKLEQQVQDEKRDKYRQYIFLGVIAAVAIIGGLGLISLTGGDDEEAANPADDIEITDGDDAGTDGDADAGTDGDTGTDDGATPPDEETLSLPCPAADGTSEQVLEFPSAPQNCLEDGAAYAAVFDTNLGTIRAELDVDKAPETVNNFVYLARYGYYDGTAFHRIISDFMIQGGDPNGNPPGTGGPGYTIAEEVPAEGEYQVGSLAMAKRNEPGTTGAQFFIVTGPNGEALPPLYSLFGQVTEGLDVVKAIEALPTDGTDYPTEEIIVNSITIEQT